MTAETGTTTTIDPAASYSPADLAPLVGLSERSIRALYRTGELRSRRIGPRRGRVVILGAWWLDYERRGEDGPEAGKQPKVRNDVQRRATTPRRAGASAGDVLAELDRSLGAR